MKQLLDKDRFGPWALVTGASSGIGKELTRQLAANGLNVVIAARRIDLLKELGKRHREGVLCAIPGRSSGSQRRGLYR